jgi:hypothetical protein
MKLLDRVRSAGIEKVAYEIKIKQALPPAPARRTRRTGAPVHRACRERHLRL